MMLIEDRLVLLERRNMIKLSPEEKFNLTINEASAYGSLLKGQHTLQLEDKDILKKMIIANNHAYDHGILDEHDATQFVYTQLGPALMKQQVIIPHEEKIQFISLLNKTPYTETEKNTILNNIGSE